MLSQICFRAEQKSDTKIGKKEFKYEQISISNTICAIVVTRSEESDRKTKLSSRLEKNYKIAREELWSDIEW